MVHRHCVPAFGDGAGAPRHAARLERDAGDSHVLPDDLRHIHDPVGGGAIGARVRRRPGARPDVRRLHDYAGDRQLRLRHLPPAAPARAQRARLVGVPRSGVPGEQLDPRVLGVFRPLRDDVSDAERGPGLWAPDGVDAVLQPVDAAGRVGPARSSPASDRCSPGAGRRSSTFAISSCFQRGSACSRPAFSWPRACASGRLGICFALSAFVVGTHHTGVLARGRRASAGNRHRSVHRPRRAGRAQQAPLRWLHRAPRDRADLPGIRGRRASSRPRRRASGQASMSRSASS